MYFYELYQNGFLYIRNWTSENSIIDNSTKITKYLYINLIQHVQDLYAKNYWILIIFLGSKITTDGDCNHEIKRRLLLGTKVMTNLDSIFKSRDITLPTKVRLVKAMVFPVVMYGCESWTVKKAESQRIDAFELWCWRRLLTVSDCKEIKPVYPKGDQSWIVIGRTVLKLKLQYFGHLMRRADSMEKTLMLGKTEDGRRRGR